MTVPRQEGQYVWEWLTFFDKKDGSLTQLLFTRIR